jgi:flagellar assembly protein FliH
VGQTLASLAQTKRKLRQEGEVELLKLSLAIARRILHREISIDAEALHGLVHAAMQKLQNREISRVRVNPAGADAVRTALERIGAAPAIEISPDPSLKSGDIIFETQFGELDASIDSQLAEIQRGFADRLSLR